MTDIETLLAIEGVRKVKAQYWHAMDTKQFHRLEALFTEDATVDFRSGRDLLPGDDYASLPPIEEALAAGDPMVVRGNRAIAAFIDDGVRDWVTVHHGAAPIIEIAGSDSASAIWPIFDFLDNGTFQLRGYGHYHDTYRRVGGAWRIESFYITRLRMDGDHPRHDEPSAAA